MEKETFLSKRSLAYVVGGAGAIGSAISKQLLKKDYQVLVLDRQEPENAQCIFIQTDLGDQKSISSALGKAQRIHGIPDALIFSAGYMKTCAFLNLDEHSIMDHININLLGAFRIARSVADLMRKKGGKIVFISSIHGQVGIPERGAYAMSKAALGAMARAMAVELSQYNIRVNTLAPGAVNAGMAPDPTSRDYWERETPSGRVARVDEIAKFASFLVSDEASFITGQTIALDGGVSNLRFYQGQAKAM